MKPASRFGTAPRDHLISHLRCCRGRHSRLRRTHEERCFIQPLERYADLHRGDVSGPVHPVSCAWSADRATLTCTPATPLEPATWHTLHLGGGVRGSNGTPIHMDPGTCGGAWAEPGLRGPASGAGHMGGETHGGVPWPMMDSGWRHPNGAYGMVITFQTS